MSSAAIFSGSSRFASDFGSIMERSVAIASLPLTQFTTEKANLGNQASALTSLTGKLSSLRAAFAALDDAKSALAVSVSSGSILSASAASNALPGNYTVDVISVGSRTNTASSGTLPVVTNPAAQSISTAATFTLAVDSTSYTIAPAAGTLDALAAAINSHATAGLQAVVVNLGSSSSPNYRLSVQSTKLGPVAIQLTEIGGGGQSLLTQISSGSLATYQINGQPSGSSLSSDVAAGVEIAPGLTIDLLQAGEADVVVKHDVSKVTGALSSLVNAYNSLVSEIDKHRGEDGGALSGESVISSLSRSLTGLFAYESATVVRNSTALGLTYDDKGVLSFDLTQFNSCDYDEVLSFLGDSDGAGLLAGAEQILSQLDDSSSGVVPLASQSLTDRIASTDKLIAANEDRIELLRQRLAAQMAAADALIGSLEQQVTYMNNLFEAMRINAQSLG